MYTNNETKKKQENNADMDQSFLRTIPEYTRPLRIYSKTMKLIIPVGCERL